MYLKPYVNVWKISTIRNSEIIAKALSWNILLIDEKYGSCWTVLAQLYPFINYNYDFFFCEIHGQVKFHFSLCEIETSSSAQLPSRLSGLKWHGSCQSPWQTSLSGQFHSEKELAFSKVRFLYFGILWN